MVARTIEKRSLNRRISLAARKQVPSPLLNAAISKFADTKHADLVVLATAARRRGVRLLLGSVAEEIFRNLKCPVFVLGPKTGAPKKLRAWRLLFANILSRILSMSCRSCQRLAIGLTVPHPT